jgi:tripartite-type tricarboxylate transporter receptor subunit TctC
MNLRIACAAALMVALTQPVSAQPYPNQTVRIVVPFSAGSNTDAQSQEPRASPSRLPTATR